MTLQQLRAICEITANDFNVSRAAVALHASQPAVSKMLATLERDLGADIFIRSKGRIAGLTDFGVTVLTLARRMVDDAKSLSDIATHSHDESSGVLRIAATHLLARHRALQAAATFAREYPYVDLEISQHNSRDVLNAVAGGDAQLGLTTLPLEVPEAIVTFQFQSVDRCVITPPGHPLLKLKRITLKKLAQYPQVTYDRSLSFGREVSAEFQRHGLQPRLAVKATSADVVKAAVSIGLGVAVFQRMAIDPEEDKGIGVLNVDHIFPPSQAHIVLRRGQYLRGYTRAFIALLAPAMKRSEIDAMPGIR